MAAKGAYRSGPPRDPAAVSRSERREIRRALEAGREEAEIVAELVERGFAKAAASRAVREVDNQIELDLDRDPPQPVDEYGRELPGHYWAALLACSVLGVLAIAVSLIFAKHPQTRRGMFHGIMVFAVTRAPLLLWAATR